MKRGEEQTDGQALRRKTGQRSGIELGGLGTRKRKSVLCTGKRGATVKKDTQWLPARAS